VQSVRPEAVDGESIARFAHEALLGLAVLDPEDFAHGNLTLPLGLSLWMRRARINIVAARDAMLEVRAVLLSASGLDQRTEPVPLLVADPVAATISLAVYVDGLLQRAARVLATSRVDMARRALVLLSE